MNKMLLGQDRRSVKYRLILEDRDMSFEEFVWRCVSGKPPLVEYEICPIGDELAGYDGLLSTFKAPPPAADWVATCERQVSLYTESLRRRDALSPEEADQEAREIHAKSLQHHEEYWVARNARVRRRMEALLERAREWTPPTPEHDPLKAFMVRLLSENMPFDLPAPTLMSGQEYVEGARKTAREYINNFTKLLDDARRASEHHDAWLSALRASVPEPPPAASEAEPCATPT